MIWLFLITATIGLFMWYRWDRDRYKYGQEALFMAKQANSTLSGIGFFLYVMSLILILIICKWG